MKKRIYHAVRTFPLDGKSDIKSQELEHILQEAYSTRDMVVVPEFFKPGSESYPQNLAFFLVTYYNWANQYGRGNMKIATSIVTNEKVEVTTNNVLEEFLFRYVTKFGVLPGYQENGVGEKTLKVTVAISLDEPKHVPTILRTSDMEVHHWYSKRSDIETPEPIHGYLIHGYGFLKSKVTGEELFEGAKLKFGAGARHVAFLPKTVVPIGSLSERTT